ncbi:MAG: phosphotransferase [Myxococcota bacterium]
MPSITEKDEERIQSLCEGDLARRPERIQSIAAGLGARRFYRLHFAEGSPETLIARQDPEVGEESQAPPPPTLEATDSLISTHAIARLTPPTWRPEPALEPLRSFLEKAGLAVPRSFARSPEVGLEILEDVGGRTLLSAAGSERDALYEHACGFVVALQSLAAPAEEIPAFGRIYDQSLLASKLWKFEHWTIPGLLGREATSEERNGLAEVFKSLWQVVGKAPRRLAHRDFKAENLHWVEREAPARELVMIDVQGAFMAPPEYDLVCLLYDLQVDLDEDWVQSLAGRIRPQLPDAPDEAIFRQRFDCLAIARLAKDVSHVVEAGLIRGDLRRWSEIPRGLELLSQAAGRQEHTFPCLRALTSVIPTLTEAARSADSRRAELESGTKERLHPGQGAA